MYVAKLVTNDNLWTAVSGQAQCGVSINTETKKHYYFGLEEWMNHSILKKMKLGYLDCYRHNTYNDVANRIALISFNKNTKTVTHVGNLYDVRQLKDDEIAHIKQQLAEQNWLKIIENNFRELTDERLRTGYNKFLECWNASQISNSFNCNISYERITIFPPAQQINLTVLNKLVNNWKRLSQRFIVSEELENLFN